MATDNVIGYGEIGRALFEILKVGSAEYYDKEYKEHTDCKFMHICLPHSDEFLDIVHEYSSKQKPKYIVVHSSVPVGTTKHLEVITGVPCLHSPVRGRHPDMLEGLKTYVKYLSHVDPLVATVVKDHLVGFGLRIKIVPSRGSTELMKLLELSRYGVYLAFAKEQEEICDYFGYEYSDIVTEYDQTRNEGLFEIGLDKFSFPLLTPFKDYVGGHCTVEDMGLLLDQHESFLLRGAFEKDRGTTIWGNSNIYKTAKIGKGCSIGHGCEIGDKVAIGDRVRIGAMCFIPEGVTIEDDVFIAPKVTFSNDKNPPSSRANWGQIHVGKGAAIGMGSIILPCANIGEGALIGAGSIVTKSVPAGEKWYGVAAESHGKR